MFNMFASAGPGDRLGCSLPASGHQPITRQLCCFSSCRRDVWPRRCKHGIIPANQYPTPTTPHSGIIARPPEIITGSVLKYSLAIVNIIERVNYLEVKRSARSPNARSSESEGRKGEDER